MKLLSIDQQSIALKHWAVASTIYTMLLMEAGGGGGSRPLTPQRAKCRIDQVTCAQNSVQRQSFMLCTSPMAVLACHSVCDGGTQCAVIVGVLLF